MSDLVTLLITNGTDTVDLLAYQSNIVNALWPPEVAGFKGGGVFSQSSVNDGRRLVDFAFDNVQESFNLVAHAFTMDDFIRELQKLRRLLVGAARYWAEPWNVQPTWLEAKAYQETNPRYALVVHGSLRGDPDPASLARQPEAGAYTLTLERQQWQSNLPGNSTAVPISSSYFGSGFGATTPSTGHTVWVRNANPDLTLYGKLTHIFQYTAAGGTYSANKLGTARPYTLLDGNAVNNAAYFGTVPFGSIGGPFSNLIFNLSVIRNLLSTTVWEYWSGATWSTLNVDGRGQSMIFTGLNGVFWANPTNWASTAVNGVTAFWVRIRVTGAGGAGVATQQTDDVYTAFTGYGEVAATAIGGDLPALVDIRLGCEGQGLVSSPAVATRRVIMGLRSVDRGLFNAYWVPSLVSADTESSNVADARAAAGIVTYFNPPAASAMQLRGHYLIQPSLGYGMFGTYRVFARIRRENLGGGLSEISFQFRLSLHGTYEIFRSENRYSTQLSVVELIEFGRVSFPYITESAGSSYWQVEIWASAASGTPDVYIYDIILMPVDEWSGEYLIDSAGVPIGSQASDMQLEITPNASAKFPFDTNTQAVDFATGQRYGKFEPWQAIAASPPLIWPRKQSQLWVLTAELGTAPPTWISHQETVLNLELFATQRYLSSRGSD